MIHIRKHHNLQCDMLLLYSSDHTNFPVPLPDVYVVQVHQIPFPVTPISSGVFQAILQFHRNPFLLQLECTWKWNWRKSVLSWKRSGTGGHYCINIIKHYNQV